MASTHSLLGSTLGGGAATISPEPAGAASLATLNENARLHPTSMPASQRRHAKAQDLPLFARPTRERTGVLGLNHALKRLRPARPHTSPSQSAAAVQAGRGVSTGATRRDRIMNVLVSPGHVRTRMMYPAGPAAVKAVNETLADSLLDSPDRDDDVLAELAALQASAASVALASPIQLSATRARSPATAPMGSSLSTTSFRDIGGGAAQAPALKYVVVGGVGWWTQSSDSCAPCVVVIAGLLGFPLALWTPRA